MYKIINLFKFLSKLKFWNIIKMLNGEIDYLIKIVLTGDSYVGKSNILS